MEKRPLMFTLRAMSPVDPPNPSAAGPGGDNLSPTRVAPPSTGVRAWCRSTRAFSSLIARPTGDPATRTWPDPMSSTVPTRHRQALRGRARPLAATLVALLLAALAPVASAPPAAAAAGDFVPLTPIRFLDTRAGGGAKVAGNTVRELQIGGVNGIPLNAEAAAINLTITEPSGSGHASVMPCDTTNPSTSTLNYAAGATIANAVVAKLSAGGRLCIYTFASTHLVVDVTGYFPAGNDVETWSPTRVVDTRTTGGIIGAGASRTIQVGGTNGVPANAEAVILNVTATGSLQPGFLTVHPCGAVPPTSTLNYPAGGTVANGTIVRLSASGQICVYAHSASHAIIDVGGWFPSGSTFDSLAAPARLHDTRSTGGLTGTGEVRTVDVTGVGGVPADAATVVLNLTITSPTGSGVATVFPCGTNKPNASAINWVGGQTIANGVLAKVSAAGTVCVWTQTPTHFIVDVTGSLPGEIGGGGGSDTTNPSVSFDLDGTGSGSSFIGTVTVSILSDDTGGSGLSGTTYQLDGGPMTTYAGPFQVSAPGSHTITAIAADNAGNTGTATTTFSISDPAAGPDIDATTFLTELGLFPRLAFSSMNREPDDRTAVIRNVGSVTLNVTSVTLTGTGKGQFRLPGTSANAFALAPGESRTISVRFAPNFRGSYEAAVTFASNDPDEPTFDLELGGVAHDRGSDGSGLEPTLQAIVDTIGYTTDVGFTTNFQATEPRAYGEEILSPHFTRIDPSKPVRYLPIARYVAPARSANRPVTGDTGTTVFNSSSVEFRYAFANDTVDDPLTTDVDETDFPANQMLFPPIAAGTTSFNRTGDFGLYSNFNVFSVDAFNRNSSGETFHNMRIYPAKNQRGEVIPGVYIAASDIKVNEDPEDPKNYDYQDQVHLLLNVRATTGTVAPNPGDPSLNLDFSTDRGGIKDKDGEGTGFDNVQANTPGNEYQPSKIDLQTAAGELQITSTAGKSSGTSDTQQNALEKSFNGTGTGFTLEARLLDPASDITKPFQQKALYFGPGQNDYVKIEIEQRNDPVGTYITLFREIASSTGTPARTKLATPGSITTLDLRLAATKSTGIVTASYSINGGAFTTLGSFTIPSGSRPAFFSTAAKGGILTSHTAPSGVTNPAVVARFDSFRIV